MRISDWSSDVCASDLIKTLFFGKMPLPLRLFVPRMAHKGTQAKLSGQGIGRHTREEIYALGAQDLNAMSEILGDKPFFFGQTPSMADASAYGILVSIQDRKSTRLNSSH